ADPPPAPLEVPAPLPAVPPCALTFVSTMLLRVAFAVSSKVRLEVPVPPAAAIESVLPPPLPPAAVCVRYNPPPAVRPLTASVTGLDAAVPPLAPLLPCPPLPPTCRALTVTVEAPELTAEAVTAAVAPLPPVWPAPLPVLPLPPMPVAIALTC